MRPLAVKVSLSFDRLLDLIYPRNCIVTGYPVSGGAYRYLSDESLRELYRVEPPFCPTCGQPFYGRVISARNCPHCKELNPVFNRGRSLLLYRGLGRTLIHELKYKGARYLLEDIKKIMRGASAISDYLDNAILVPVPLHRRKLRERGFNQSLLIAECFAEVAGGIPVVDALERNIDTATQTRLNRRDRLRNVKNDFSLSKKTALINSSRIIVVDDVFTTGHTLNACCTVLRRAGYEQLDVLTLGHGQ
jgi:ComF family protein